MRTVCACFVTHACLDQFVDIRQLIDPPAQLDHPLHLIGGQRQNGLIAKLFVQLLVGHRPMDIAERLLHETADLFARRQFHFDVRLILGKRRIAHGGRALAHAFDGWIVHGFVGVFANTRLAAHQADGRAMINGKLALQTARDVLLVAEIQHQRRHAQAHRADGFRRRLVFVMNLNRAVDGGVIHNSAWKWFIGVGAQIEVDAQSCRDLGQIVLRRLHRRKASWTFQTMYTRREPGLREQRRGVAILRRAARMQRLRHGPEHLAQSRRLRGREPDGPNHLLLRQADQLADGDCGAEYARRTGDVPADVVVRGINRVPDPRLGFKSQDERVHKIAATYLIRTGVGKQRRCYRRTWMNVILGRGVVVVVHVRADAVHQRSVQRINALGAPQNARGAADRRMERTRTSRYSPPGRDSRPARIRCN